MADFKTDEKGQLLITWKEGDDSKAVAFNKMYAALQKVEPIRHSVSGSDIYKDIYTGNVSIRDEFNINDYELYRPGERAPRSDKGRIKAANQVYKDLGLIRNIVDLMGDFSVQGIDLAHPNKKVEKFYKKWWKLVKGKERSERLSNLLVRHCSVIAKRETGRLTVKQAKQFHKVQGGPTDPVEIDTVKIDPYKREIPTQYTFLNPLTIEIIGDELNHFIDSKNFKFGISLPSSIIAKIQYPRSQDERELIARLPVEIVNAVRRGEKLVPLDNRNIKSSYYKKDDWEQWAYPIICSVLDEVKTLQKMRLADRAALDGAISQIRLWKLGDLENKILPTDAAVEKLANILVNSVGGGIVDLIWGPAIELTESTTTLHQFLGNTKYEPLLNAIYAGLGIPPLFTGASSQGSFTNNFLAIKTLIERLQYIRERVIEFWEPEIELVRQAMDFEQPASLVFDRMTLNDEASVLTLITGLVDRDIISEEYAQEMVGAIPEIEEFRLKREQQSRKSGKKPIKASPYHSPMVKEDYTKLFVQQGVVTPAQVGVELEEKGEGEQIPNDIITKNQAKVAKLTKPKVVGKSGQGRPKSKKDSKKRKQKEVKPRRSVKAFLQANLWAEDAQTAISEYFTPIYLKTLNKKNLRQLTDKEFNNFEQFKFSVLANLSPGQEISDSALKAIVSEKLEQPVILNKLLEKTIDSYTQKYKAPTTEQRRKLQSGVYAVYHSDKVGTPEVTAKDDESIIIE